MSTLISAYINEDFEGHNTLPPTKLFGLFFCFLFDKKNMNSIIIHIWALIRIDRLHIVKCLVSVVKVICLPLPPFLWIGQHGNERVELIISRLIEPGSISITSCDIVAVAVKHLSLRLCFPRSLLFFAFFGRIQSNASFFFLYFNLSLKG